MATLNLRGIPADLKSRLKSEAALAGCTLRDYCVRLLSNGKGYPVAPDGGVVVKHGYSMPWTPDAEFRAEDVSPHHPGYCQLPGCRECKRLREGL